MAMTLTLTADARHPALIISEIVQQAEEVCALLCSPGPERLDRCTELLESASRNLSSLKPHLHPARVDPAALSAAQRLQSVLQRASQLLETAGNYHEQWQQRLGAALAGYRPGGNPGAVPRDATLWLEG